MSGFLDALMAVGNVLDLPASSVRDALLLRNPLDQWSRPTSDMFRTTSHELLKRYGVIKDRGRGIGNALLTFGTDVAMDPLNVLGVAEAQQVPVLLKALRGG